MMPSMASKSWPQRTTKPEPTSFKAHDFSRARNALCALQVSLKENNLEEFVAQKGGIVPA
jgi:hypothetical protein